MLVYHSILLPITKTNVAEDLLEDYSLLLVLVL